MKLAIKVLLIGSPVSLGAAVACYQIGVHIARQSPPDSFDGLEWVIAASRLSVVAILSPFLALGLWIVYRGQNPK